MKIVIPILKNCLAICERYKSRILCFELNAVEKYNASRRFSKRLEILLEKKKKKRRKDARTKIGNFVYIAADAHTSWKKVKRMCL